MCQSGAQCNNNMDADGGVRAKAQGSTFERNRRGLIACNSTGSSVGGLNVIKSYTLVKLTLIHTHTCIHTHMLFYPNPTTQGQETKSAFREGAS